MATENVEPQDPMLQNSPKVAGGNKAAAEANLEALSAHRPCQWNGKEYSDGGTVCDSHIRYKCWDGKWLEIGMC